MSVKNCLKRYKKSALGLIVISIFLLSLYIPVFYFSQISNNPLINIPPNYLLNNNVNSKDSTNGQSVSNTVDVYGYDSNNNLLYVYANPWTYSYLGQGDQIRITLTHTIQNRNVKYIVIVHPYSMGWKFESNSSGTVVPINWTTGNGGQCTCIKDFTDPVTVTWIANTTYTYSGITFTSGNEPITYTGNPIITRNGSTLRFQFRDGVWTDTRFILPGDPEMNCFSAVSINSGSNPDYANTPWSSTEYSNGRNDDNAGNHYEQTAADWSSSLVWNRYVANLSWFSGQDGETARLLNDIIYSFKGYTQLQGTNLWGTLFYKDNSGTWHAMASLPNPNQATLLIPSSTITSNVNGLLQNDQTLVFGAGASAQSFTWPNYACFWGYWYITGYTIVDSDTTLYVNQVKAQVDYNWHYTWANLTYHGTSFNTNDYPWLFIKYKSSSTNNWNFWLTNGGNDKAAKPLSLVGTNGQWNTVKVNISDIIGGGIYDGFHLEKNYNDQFKNDWIEFDYVLTGREVEVNSLNQNGTSNLTVSAADGNQNLGTTNNPLNVSGSIRQMDGYDNPFIPDSSQLGCTLELWKDGVQKVCSDTVYNSNSNFVYSIVTGDSQPLSTGSYTVKIKPHWTNPRYPDVELNFSLYPLTVSDTDWRTGNGTVEVIEKVGANYYTYNDAWQYRYAPDGTIQTRIMHNLENEAADYLLVGYKDGWNLNETLLKGGTLSPYPDDFSSFRIQAGSDDWNYTSTTYSTVKSSVYLGTDYSGTAYSAGFRWPLSIPHGSTILSSTLTLTALNRSSLYPFTTNIRLYDQDNCSSPDSSIQTWNTTGDVLWTLNNWIPGEEYTSPDITSLVQSFIDRSGYIPGKYTGLVLDAGNSTTGIYRSAYTYDNRQDWSARLDIKYVNPTYTNYYWIQEPATHTMITFDVNQTLAYNGINVVTGNEPFTIFGNPQALELSGNTFTFAPIKQNYNVTDTLSSYTKSDIGYNTYTPPYGFESVFMPIGQPSSLQNTDKNYYYQGSFGVSSNIVYLKGYINPANYMNLADWKCTQIDLNYTGHAIASGSTTDYNSRNYSWNYWTQQWSWDGSKIPTGSSDISRSTTWIAGNSGAPSEFNDTVGMGVLAYSTWASNNIGVGCSIEMWSDLFSGTCHFESRYSSLRYDCSPFNTNDEPYLIVRYRTSSGTPQNWSFYLTSGDNRTAYLIPLSSSTNWNTSIINIKDGNTYDGFFLNSSDWGQSIQFDYILTGHLMEVNSLNQTGDPVLQVYEENPTSIPGSSNNPLHVNGTIRQMDGYSNPTSNLSCTLELWMGGLFGSPYNVVNNVNGAFDCTINNLGSQLSDGNVYTVIIKSPYGENPHYSDANLSFCVKVDSSNNYQIVTLDSQSIIQVIEENSSGYYTYNDPLVCQYVNRETQINITHTLKNNGVEYLLVGYRSGWNLNSATTSGQPTLPLVPYQDANMRNYYWINTTSLKLGSQINVTFDSNQTFTYNGVNVVTDNGINLVTGNEPFTVVGAPNSLTLDGNNVTFSAIKLNDVIITDTLLSFHREITGKDSGSLTGFSSTSFIPLSPSAMQSVSASDNTYYSQTASSINYNGVETQNSEVFIKGFINPTDYGVDLNYWKCYQISVSYSGKAGVTYPGSMPSSSSSCGYQFFVWGYWDPQDWNHTSDMNMIGAFNTGDQFVSKQFNAGNIVTGGEFIGPVGLGVDAYFFNNNVSTVNMYNDQLQGTCYYAQKYASMSYYSDPFNTINEPYLIVKYRTSSNYNPTNWNFYLSSQDNKIAKLITSLSGSTQWNTSVIPIPGSQDGNTYNGFFLNSSDWGQWIQFDYILTGHPQVNSPSPTQSNGNLNVTITNPTMGSTVNYGVVWINGTYNSTGSNIAQITINDTRFGLMQPSIGGSNYGTSGIYSFRASCIPASEFGVEVTVEDVTGNMGTAARHVAVVDMENPTINLNSHIDNSPESLYTSSFIKNDIVWINGTFNGTGSPIRSITINDSRFVLVERDNTDPNGITGSFSFKNPTPIVADKSTPFVIFDLNITVKDYAGNTKTIIVIVLALNPNFDEYTESMILGYDYSKFYVMNQLIQDLLLTPDFWQIVLVNAGAIFMAILAFLA
ncbi:MAG: hypothetical protein WED07_11670 [Candidatus Freyarchaeum deiterrae]